jgi:hypothetical protein
MRPLPDGYLGSRNRLPDGPTPFPEMGLGGATGLIFTGCASSEDRNEIHGQQKR